MPAIINSAPDCITHVEGAKPADDTADFILQANYQDCAGFMTFGPGTTYGDGGAAATTAYYVLTWFGDRRHGAGLRGLGHLREPAAARVRREQRAEPGDSGPPPQPGTPSLGDNV